MPQVAQRDNKWLLLRLVSIWSKYFCDVDEINPIQIKFGRYSKYRLGSIKLEKKSRSSTITITSMFRDKNIPSKVVDHTIAHELVHYAHGFSSKRTRLHKYPHAGGVVQKEMEERGVGYLNKAYRKWVVGYKQQLIEDAR